MRRAFLLCKIDSLSVEDLENLPPTASMEEEAASAIDVNSDEDVGRRENFSASPAPSSGFDAEPRRGKSRGVGVGAASTTSPTEGEIGVADGRWRNSRPSSSPDAGDVASEGESGIISKLPPRPEE